MILRLSVNTEGGWHVQVEHEQLWEETVERAEGVLAAVERGVQTLGGWSGLTAIYVDANSTSSFTNRRLLSVWMNAWAHLYPALACKWRISHEDIWQDWRAPMELPYGAEPNISSSHTA
jgi:hypothetical protein